MFKKLKQEQGFTIIEVLIVLAIAGLIMLIVFLAIPALQRNQRNNGRNADASRIVAAVNECLANRTTLTTSCDTDAEVEQGAMSQLTGGIGAAPSTTVAQLQFANTCNAAGSAAVAGTARQFAVTYTLEPAIARCIGSE